MAASTAGHLGIVKELLRTGADVNARDNYNDSALTLAAQNVIWRSFKY
jgi:ankyrin repeat protein